MTIQKIAAAMFLVLFVSIPSAFTETKTTGAPKAVLPDSIHVFEPVVEGVMVSHDFILENQGDADLVIETIQTG